MNIGYIIAITYITSFIILFIFIILNIILIVTPPKLQYNIGITHILFRLFWNFINIAAKISIFFITLITVVIIFCWIFYIFILILVRILQKTVILSWLGCKIYKVVMLLPLINDFKQIGFFAILDRLVKGKNIIKPISNFIYLSIIEPTIQKYPKYEDLLKNAMYFPNDILIIQQECKENLKIKKEENNINSIVENNYIEKKRDLDFQLCKISKNINITPDMNIFQVQFVNIQNKFIDAECQFLNSIK